MNDEFNEMGFMVELTDHEINTLLYAVGEALRVWPGSPARPAEEQEELRMLRDSFFRMKLESVWERSEGEGPR